MVLRLLPPRTWIAEMKVKRSQPPLEVLGQSERETITIEPISGLVIDEIKRNGKTVDEKVFSVSEARRYFSMFKTRARAQALMKLERRRKDEEDSAGRREIRGIAG